MFCDRQTNNRVNKINDKNLQLRLTEIYKTIHNLNPCFIKEVFTERISGYNLRNISRILLLKPNKNSYGIESATYMGSKLWLELTNDIKTFTSLQIFKEKIRTYTNEKCNCRLCKPYISQIGFLK